MLRCFLYFHVSSNELIVAWIDNLSKKVSQCPVERLLSAYLDKVNGKQRDRDHFLMSYNMTVTPSFAEFVHEISRNRTVVPLGGAKSKEKLHGVDWCKHYMLLLPIARP